MDNTHEQLPSLGNLIRERRRALRWTQTDLAELIGVTRQLIADIERGNPTVSVGTFCSASVEVGLRLILEPMYADGLS